MTAQEIFEENDNAQQNLLSGSMSLFSLSPSSASVSPANKKEEKDAYEFGNDRPTLHAPGWHSAGSPNETFTLVQDCTGKNDFEFRNLPFYSQVIFTSPTSQKELILGTSSIIATSDITSSINNNQKIHTFVHLFHKLLFEPEFAHIYLMAKEVLPLMEEIFSKKKKPNQKETSCHFHFHCGNWINSGCVPITNADLSTYSEKQANMIGNSIYPLIISLNDIVMMKMSQYYALMLDKFMKLSMPEWINWKPPIYQMARFNFHKHYIVSSSSLSNNKKLKCNEFFNIRSIATKFGFVAVFFIGDFTGGEILLKDFKVKIQVKPGDLLFFRGGIKYSIYDYVGTFGTIVLFTEEKIFI
ncbi:11660_t:CDS:2 [Ambispora gerdemannii]|uniref:11660_t:CDS:1 n=1 Tax=Ambispora gerdemannii TaxID=144530 RepID=A0A9N8VWM3_9GLOM|nr:11660_t:CDS:2 [Ambispora gerdemannii]